jgi:hypothetical protein
MRAEPARLGTALPFESSKQKKEEEEKTFRESIQFGLERFTKKKKKLKGPSIEMLDG